MFPDPLLCTLAGVTRAGMDIQRETRRDAISDIIIGGNEALQPWGSPGTCHAICSLKRERTHSTLRNAWFGLHACVTDFFLTMQQVHRLQKQLKLIGRWSPGKQVRGSFHRRYNLIYISGCHPDFNRLELGKLIRS